jgi:hypothetical protein
LSVQADSPGREVDERPFRIGWKERTRLPPISPWRTGGSSQCSARHSWTGATWWRPPRRAWWRTSCRKTSFGRPGRRSSTAWTRTGLRGGTSMQAFRRSSTCPLCDANCGDSSSILILAMVERKWNLPSFTQRDAAAAGLAGFLDLTQPALADPPTPSRAARRLHSTRVRDRRSTAHTPAGICDNRLLNAPPRGA